MNSRERTEAVLRETPSCSTCDDTHVMSLRGRDVMCTRCPVPCQECRRAGGAYCSSTPCGCECHEKLAAPDPVRDEIVRVDCPDFDEVKRVIIAAYGLDPAEVDRIEISIIMRGKIEKITVNVAT